MILDVKSFYICDSNVFLLHFNTNENWEWGMNISCE